MRMAEIEKYLREKIGEKLDEELEELMKEGLTRRAALNRLYRKYRRKTEATETSGIYVTTMGRRRQRIVLATKNELQFISVFVPPEEKLKFGTIYNVTNLEKVITERPDGSKREFLQTSDDTEFVEVREITADDEPFVHETRNNIIGFAEIVRVIPVVKDDKRLEPITDEGDVNLRLILRFANGDTYRTAPSIEVIEELGADELHELEDIRDHLLGMPVFVHAAKSQLEGWCFIRNIKCLEEITEASDNLEDMILSYIAEKGAVGISSIIAKFEDSYPTSRILSAIESLKLKGVVYERKGKLRPVE